VRAIEEYDRLGQDRFLAEYGFGRATAYLLIYRGRSYDSKAILGVAYNFAMGVRLSAHDFSGGVYCAAGVLRKLGFDVRNVRDFSRPADGRPCTPRHPSQGSWTCACPSPQRPASSARYLDRVDP
jgi:hypothetical protein